MRKLLLIILLLAVACSCFGWRMQRDYDTIVHIDTLTATDTTVVEDLSTFSVLPGGVKPDRFVVLAAITDSAYTDSTYGVSAVANTATIRIDGYAEGRWWFDIQDSLYSADQNFGTLILEINNNYWDQIRFITTSNVGWVTIRLAYINNL